MVLTVVALALGGLSGASSAYAAPGDLDPPFSGDGKLTTDFGRDERVGGAAVQTDGKLVVGGNTQGNTVDNSSDFAIARYTTGGALDTSFSTDGKVTTDFGGDERNAVVAVQQDGKIVAAGTTVSCDAMLQVPCTSGFAVARYNVDGSLDTGFSTDGKVITSDFGGDADAYVEARTVVVQPDGKIVVGGTSTQATSNDRFALARYNPDGSLDPSFSGDGKEVTDLGGIYSGPDLALAPGGKLVMLGGAEDSALVRYNGDGSLDRSFSGDGKIIDPNSDASDLVVLPDGRIFLAGVSQQTATFTRLATDGSRDTTFSGDGRASTSIPGSYYGGALALQPDGKIIVGGTSEATNGDGGQADDFAVLRFNPSGSLDDSFSGDGRTPIDFGGLERAEDVILQADGAIVAVGTTFSSNQSDFALVRLQGGGPPPDEAPPDTAINSGPAGATSSATPTFGFSSSETGSSFECRVDTAAFAPCSSPHTTTSLGNGAHTFDVRATDVAGNVDPTPASRGFTVSTAQPQAPNPQPQPTPAPIITPLFITPPPIATDPPEIGGGGSAGTLTVSSKGLFTLRRQAVDCTGPGPDCAARTSMTGSLPASKASSSARRKTVKLGGSSFKVKAGQEGKAKVKLTRKGLKLLKRLKRIKARITITVKRGAIAKKKTVRVTLKAPKKKR